MIESTSSEKYFLLLLYSGTFRLELTLQAPSSLEKRKKRARRAARSNVYAENCRSPKLLKAWGGVRMMRIAEIPEDTHKNNSERKSAKEGNQKKKCFGTYRMIR